MESAKLVLLFGSGYFYRYRRGFELVVHYNAEPSLWAGRPSVERPSGLVSVQGPLPGHLNSTGFIPKDSHQRHFSRSIAVDP